MTQNFDCIFWCGDLNFRLSQPRDEVVQWVAEQSFPVPEPLALQSDQLFNSRIEGRQGQVLDAYSQFLSLYIILTNNHVTHLGVLVL